MGTAPPSSCGFLRKTTINVKDNEQLSAITPRDVRAQHRSLLHIGADRLRLNDDRLKDSTHSMVMGRTRGLFVSAIARTRRRWGAICPRENNDAEKRREGVLVYMVADTHRMCISKKVT